MGYDLYFHNLTDEDHERIAGIGEIAMETVPHEHTAAGMERALGAFYNGMRSTGKYERASMNFMPVLCDQLRAQGAGNLADEFAYNDAHLKPDLILSELKGVSVIPIGPAPEVHAVVDLAVMIGRPPTEPVALTDEDWTWKWCHFVSFLVRAAIFGDGVDIT